MSYDTILLDLDGTITESAPGIINAIRHALVKLSRPIPDGETLNKFIGPPLIDSFRKYCGLDHAGAEQALTYYREYYSTKGIFECRVYDGVEEMLKALKGRTASPTGGVTVESMGRRAASPTGGVTVESMGRRAASPTGGVTVESMGRRAASPTGGVKICLATAKPEGFARRILDHFDLTQYFDEVYGATMDESRNRKAGVIAWALSHSGDLGRVIMVGDRADDVLGARANGLDTIGVLYGYGNEAELRNAGAIALAATPADVVRLILP